MDPIFTPIFAAALGSGGLALGATTTGFLVPLLSGLATTALGIVIAMLLRPDPPTPENGQVPIQQAIPPRTYGYGRARIAGYVVFLEVSAGRLFQIQALIGHEIDAFEDFYLNDDLVRLIGFGDEGNGNTRYHVHKGEDGRYETDVEIQFRYGKAHEHAYLKCHQAFKGEWPTQARGDGIASMMLICHPADQTHFSIKYPYGKPTPSSIMRLAKVFDPRDRRQRWSDPSSFRWSDNPVLCILHFQCFSDYGPRRDYRKAILPVLDQWIHEANICEQAMPLHAGGTEHRYRCGGYMTTEHNDPRSTLQTMLSACDGWFMERGDGTCVLKVGYFRNPKPAITLTDEDITGWYIESNLPNADRAEYLKATYTSPDNGYSSVDTDLLPLDNGPLTTNQKRVGELKLTWVQSTGQASRLLKREAIRYAEPRRGKLELRLSALNCLHERWVRIQSDSIPGMEDVIVENRKPVISILEGRCSMEFVQSGREIDDYNPAEDESTPPNLPARPSDVGGPLAGNVNATAEMINSGGHRTVYLDVSWDTPELDDPADLDEIDWRVRWRDTGFDETGGNFNQHTYSGVDSTTSRMTVRTPPVPVGTELSVEVCSLGTGGPSAFSPGFIVSTVLADIAPGSPANFTAVGASGHAHLQADAPNSKNFNAMQWSRGAVGAPFNTTSALGTLTYGNANQTLSINDSVAAGSYDYWVQALNPDGVASTPTGPQTATVT